MMLKSCALIPAYNEEEFIASTIQALRAVKGLASIIVVDDASTDATHKRACEAGAEVIRLERRQGKGGALEHAVTVLEERGSLNSFDAVVLIDADVGASASQAQLLLDALVEGADMAIAGFPPATTKAGFGMVMKRAHKAILTLGNFDARSPLSGQRALTIPCLQAVRPFAQGFGIEVAMSIRALWANMRLVEAPTSMTHRASGRNLRGFLHRGKQYCDVRRTVRRLSKERSSSLQDTSPSLRT